MTIVHLPRGRAGLASTFDVWTSDEHLLHEIVYSTILSRVSEQLEQRGWTGKPLQRIEPLE